MRSSTPLRSATWRASVARPSRQVDHRRGAGRGERAALVEPRPRAQVAVATSGRVGRVRRVVERPPPGLGSAQLAGHPDEVARPRAVAPDELLLRVGPAGHRHREHQHRARAPRRRPRWSRPTRPPAPPCHGSARAARPTSSGSTTDTYASPASAPIAARSDSAVASAFQPMSRRPWVARRKCTPSTSVSIEVTAKGRARVTAASSPVHAPAGRCGRRARSRSRRSARARPRRQPAPGHQPGAAVPLPCRSRCRSRSHCRARAPGAAPARAASAFGWSSGACS